MKASDFQVVASQLVHKVWEAEARAPPEENKFSTSALCAAESASLRGKYAADLMLYMEGTIIANHWPEVRHCKPRLLVTDDCKFFKVFDPITLRRYSRILSPLFSRLIVEFG